MRHEILMALYRAGDSIGAVAEGGGPGTVSYEDAMKGITMYPKGTDETDSANLFLEYAKDVGTKDIGIYGWSTYHLDHKSCTSYGKTWKDHFATVKAIRDYPRHEFAKTIMEISKDRDSWGNGCLSLSYPMAYCGLSATQASIILMSSHYRSSTVATDAFSYFSGLFTLDQLEALAEINIGKTGQTGGDFFAATPLSPQCLWAAVQVAKQPTTEEAIKFALSKGGDVDSYLSLGLLIWGFERVGGAFPSDRLGDRSEENTIDCILLP